MKTRHQEIQEQVREFHEKHPEVWGLFVKFTFELIRRGFKHYGAMGIFQRIRWQTDKPDNKGKGTFKLNNNYFPFYARSFMREYPDHKGFFRTREQKSKDEPATKTESTK